MVEAQLLFSYEARQGALLMEMVVWQLPETTADRPHGIEYRLYLGREGKTLVRYDNEAGKGDHRHVGPERRRSPTRSLAWSGCSRTSWPSANPLDGEKTMKRINVEVMSSEAAARRLTKAWRSAERRDPVEPVVGVGSISELTALLSPKRMELLRFVADHPGLSVRALAGALKRDYKNVHTDVAALAERHLLARDAAGRVSAPYDEIVIRAPLRKAA